MFHINSILHVVAVSLALGSVPRAVGAPNSEVNVSHRSLASASLAYDWEPGCCSSSSTGCQHGDAKIIFQATATTGNSFSASLSMSGVAFSGFDNSLHCDEGGIICWTGVMSGDTSGQVCVHYANTYNCADFTAQELGSANCVKSEQFIVNM